MYYSRIRAKVYYLSQFILLSSSSVVTVFYFVGCYQRIAYVK